MSNPKPVGGAILRDFKLRDDMVNDPAALRSALMAGIASPRWNALEKQLANLLLAALSAAPAPDENALIDARERGYDDACSTSLPFSQDAEADFRKWRDLNPDADLRSAWIAGRANEAASQGVKLTKANVAGYEKGFKAAQEYFPEAALNKLVRDWEARVGEKPIERRGAYEAALDDCINELRSIWTPARDGVRLELEEVCRVICYCCANPKSGYQPAKLETSGIWEGEWVHRNSAEVDPKMSVHSECSANELRQYVASRAAKEQADGQR